MRESSTRVRPWREAVKAAAMDAMDRDDEFTPIEHSGVTVQVQFLFRRPQTHYRTGKQWKDLRPRFLHAPMTRKPDIDKVCRSTFDALTDAGVWADDAQVTVLTATKVWGDRITEGAWITINTKEAIDE
jgi:crossover junction endodeoxyribonuclease RusA